MSLRLFIKLIDTMGDIDGETLEWLNGLKLGEKL
jgi:hypothetical protein